MNTMDEITAKDSSLYARLLLGRARHLMVKARQKELAPYHISPRQANVLFILYNLGHKATLSELAKHTDRENNTLSIQMTRMERDGIVKKVRETPKSTLISFELTEKGIDIYKFAKQSKTIKEIMSVLSEEERQELIAILKKIIEKTEKYQ
jgi:DNA-binding MarR family transcriptional regulator